MENLQRPFLFSAFGDRLKKNFKDLFFDHLRLCPRPREGLSSEGLSLALDFFVPCFLDSTFDIYFFSVFTAFMLFFDIFALKRPNFSMQLLSLQRALNQHRFECAE